MAVDNLGQQGRPSTAIEISAGGTETQSIIEIDSYPGGCFEHCENLGAISNVQTNGTTFFRLYTAIRQTVIDHMLFDFASLSQTTDETLTFDLHICPSGDYTFDAGNKVGSFVITEGVNDSGTGYFVDLSDIAEATRTMGPVDSLWVVITSQTNTDDIGDTSVTMLGRHFRKG